MSADFRLQGFIAAPFTPMNTDGTINYAIIPEYAARLKNAGVQGVFVGGTTGESLSMTTEERMKLSETWAGEQTDGFPVIVHAGCDCLQDSVKLSRHAAEIGAAGVGAMPPVFFKPALPQLTVLLEETASACAPLPFYYYHIPSMTGVNLSMLHLAEQCGARIPNFRGIKFTHNDLVEYSQLTCFENGKYDILYGRDETLLAGLAFGARGMIGSTYNYAMPIYSELLKAWQAGDMDSARRWQIRAQKMIEILIAQGGGTVCGKALMQAAGLNLGPCRLPNRVLGDDEVMMIRKKMESAGLMPYIRI